MNREILPPSQEMIDLLEELKAENKSARKPRIPENEINTQRIFSPEFIFDEDKDAVFSLEESEEVSEEFKQLKQKFYSDADLVFEQENLEKLSNLTLKERLRLLSTVCGKSYISPNDLASYFDFFPQDTDKVIFIVLASIDRVNYFGLSDFEIYQLSCKAFETASKRHPDYWKETEKILNVDSESTRTHRLHDYLLISARSKLSREVMIGDYKKSANEIFSKYPEEVASLVGNLVDRIEDLNAYKDWGFVQPEDIFGRDAFKNLPSQVKANLLQDIITYSHNCIVFHEQYNSGFDEEARISYYSSVSPGSHSVIYQTEHASKSFSASSYNSFDTNYFAFASERPIDEAGYEILIRAAVKEMGEVRQVNVNESVDFLMNFWDTNLHPAFGPDLAQAISYLNPRRGVENILTQLPQDKESDKRRHLSLLFRLELGAIGITPEGVNYLGKRFDLGEANNPDYFVSRITSDGLVGVFDDKRTMQGYFQLDSSDFSETSQEVIKKNLQSIVQEMLFLPKVDESEQEKAMRLEYLKQFNEQYYEVYLTDFTKKTGIAFNDLTLQEQGWTFAVLNSDNDEKKESAYKFIRVYGENGLRSLIATEYGLNWGDRLISMTEVLGPDQMSQFLNTFSRLVSQSQFIGESIDSLLINSDEPSLKNIGIQLTESLIRKNKDFIVCAELIQGEKLTFRDLIESMNDYSFVLDEIWQSLELKGEQYEKADKKTEVKDGKIAHTNWILADKAKAHQVNILIRPEPAPTTVINKQTGEKETITAQAGIRLTFARPDNRFGIRLDLDPHYRDENFPSGRLTLDIGSRDSKIGQILQEVSEGGYHNAISFSPELSDPLVFKKLCEGINQAFESHFATS